MHKLEIEWIIECKNNITLLLMVNPIETRPILIDDHVFNHGRTHLSHEIHFLSIRAGPLNVSNQCYTPRSDYHNGGSLILDVVGVTIYLKGPIECHRVLRMSDRVVYGQMVASFHLVAVYNLLVDV